MKSPPGDVAVLTVPNVQSEAAFETAWVNALHEIATQDSISTPPSNTIVFTGSSSIALWRTLHEDMAPLTVINRGLSGSTMLEVVRWLDPLVLKYAPRAIVLYSGDNDIGYFGRTPNNVLEHINTFVARVRMTLPHVRIYFLTIKPSVLRWDIWPILRSANDLLRTYCETGTSLRLVDIASCMLGSDDRPRTDLFEADGLHLNAKGYQVWTSIVRPALLEVEALHQAHDLSDI